MQNYLVFIKTPSTAIVQASNPKVAEKKYRTKNTSNPDTEVMVVPITHARVNKLPVMDCLEKFQLIDMELK